jgi:sulfur transfer complex TusBCD TusB component (DsrH family)
MKVLILLKSGPDTVEAERTLTTASDMLSQGHSVTLCLLQDAVHLCRVELQSPVVSRLKTLMDRNLVVQALLSDCSLRGITPPSDTNRIATGDYSSIVNLIESADRTIGIL